MNKNISVSDQRRQGAPDQEVGAKKSRKQKPWKIECRWNPANAARPICKGEVGWRKHGNYRDRDEAQRTMNTLQRKHAFFEYRIVPPRQSSSSDQRDS